MSMEIKPSNIFYSHDTIMYRFKKEVISSRFYRGRRRTRHSDGAGPIGRTLDRLCNGECQVSDIPKITIIKKDGKWYTLDNRRLWVFHHYEAFLNNQGKSLTLTASVDTFDEGRHESRFTTTNGGVSIKIKGGHDPTGDWYKKLTPVTPRILEEQETEQSLNENGTTNNSNAKGKIDSNDIKSSTEYENTSNDILESKNVDESGEKYKSNTSANEIETNHGDQTRKRSASPLEDEDPNDILLNKRRKPLQD